MSDNSQCMVPPEWSWADQAITTAGSSGYAVVTDDRGNTYVTGFFSGTTTFGTLIVHPNNSNSNVFVAKIDPKTQQWLWVNHTNFTNFRTQGNGIDIDCDGNLYITGELFGSTMFGTLTVTSTNGTDVFVAKLNNDNGQWIDIIIPDASIGTSMGQKITIGPDGCPYIIGSYNGTVTFGATILISNSSNDDVFIAKLNINGSLDWEWAISFGGIGTDFGADITVDSDNNVYVTGNFADTVIFGTTILTSSGNQDIFIAKLDSDRVWQWAYNYVSSASDSGQGIITDNKNNVYLTATFNIFTPTITSFISKYTTDGTLLWITNSLTNSITGNVFSVSISLDPYDNAYITGTFKGTATFGTFSIESTGSLNSVFVAKINNQGDWLWAKAVDMRTTDIGGQSISVDLAGNANIVGGFRGSATFNTDIISSSITSMFIASLPTTQCDPYNLNQLNNTLICKSTDINSITICFDSNCNFKYLPSAKTGSTTINGQIVDGTGDTVLGQLNGLNPNINYNIDVDILSKCSNSLAISDTITCMTTCILPGAKVKTPTGTGYKLIENVRQGDIVIDEHNNYVKVINNIKFGLGPKDIVTIRKGSLGYGLPTDNISITHGHPIKIRRGASFSKNEYNVERLVNNHSITTRRRGIMCSYSLMTKERTFVIMNGIPVCTWSEKRFNEFYNDAKKKNHLLIHELL